MTESLNIIGNTVEFWILRQYRCKDIKEHLERVLIQEMYLIETVHREVHIGTGLGQWQVLMRNHLDLTDDLVRFFHLFAVLLISAASCFSVSNVVITESSSKILPLASFNACNSDFSSCLSLRWNSPWSFSKSERFSSMSGRWALRTWFKHWLCSELCVTVKLTKVTLEQISGGNSTVGSLVDKMIQTRAKDRCPDRREWHDHQFFSILGLKLDSTLDRSSRRPAQAADCRNVMRFQDFCGMNRPGSWFLWSYARWIRS